MAAIASPVLYPEAGVAFTVIELYKLYLETDSGPITLFKVINVPTGAIFPSLLRTKMELRDSGSVRNSKSACQYTRYVRPNRLKSPPFTRAKYNRMVFIISRISTPKLLALTTSISASNCGKLDLNVV